MKWIMVFAVVAPGWAVSVETTAVKGASEHVQVIERVVAVVNGEPILLSELEGQRIEATRMGQVMDAEKVLDFLIEDRLLKSEAQKAAEAGKIEVSQGEVEFEIKILKDRSTSEEVFLEDLRRAGLTLESLKDRLRKDLQVRRLMQQEVHEKISVTDADIEKSYQENKIKFSDPDLLRLRVLRLTKESDVKKVQEDLKSGKTFLEILNKYGDEEAKLREGMMGEVDLKELGDSLRAAIEPLRVGEVSQPALYEGVWFVFKVEDRTPGRQLTLVDTIKIKDQLIKVKEVLRRTLQNKFSLERYQAWVSQLRESAAIEKRLP